MLKPRDDKIKRLALRNELMGKFALKYEQQIETEATRLKKEEEIGLQAKARFAQEIEEKDKLLKEYEVKVRIGSVELNESKYNTLPTVNGLMKRIKFSSR